MATNRTDAKEGESTLLPLLNLYTSFSLTSLARTLSQNITVCKGDWVIQSLLSLLGIHVFIHIKKMKGPEDIDSGRQLVVSVTCIFIDGGQSKWENSILLNSTILTEVQLLFSGIICDIQMIRAVQRIPHNHTLHWLTSSSQKIPNTVVPNFGGLIKNMKRKKNTCFYSYRTSNNCLWDY